MKHPLANLAFEEMQRAIPKLNKGIESLKNFDINQVQTGRDASLIALSQSISRIITNIFGNDTHEYYQYHSFADLTYLNMSLTNDRSPIIKNVREKISRAIATLESITQHFLEELEDSGREGSSSKAIKAYQGLKLHPEIEKVASQLFLHGHYAHAIEDSVKALNNLVRVKSGLPDDGVSLMQKAFSLTNPLLKFNLLTDKSDEEEQKGFMNWFTGTVSGLRNPRAHKIIKDDPEMALEFIAFVSLQAKLLDKTTVNTKAE